MRLFIGLGNPGKKYASTRHNAGVNALLNIFSDLKYKEDRKLLSYTAVYQNNEEKIIIIFPQTFMNLSGDAVSKALSFYKINIQDAVVFHDEVELKEGELRYKFDGGHKGHNGLRDIIQKCGSNFHRIRLGVGRPPDERISVADYVLAPSDLSFLPSKEEILNLLHKNNLFG
ncbi:MAG: aminoacyl-tRNA hydrolase [Spirochaetia bacterium]|nr:aminoacyl-tRNA hydrolase [Spirochaetia bacterium]